MNETINNFIEWWKKRSPELAKQIFHNNLNYQSCGKGNSKDVMLNSEPVSGSSDLKLIKKFVCNDEAHIIFEETDEITFLYYRHSFYLKLFGDKIIEIIETKESVAK